MDLDQIRYFVSVAREGSYTRAAQSEYARQPHLWRKVRALESELGLRLFEKVGRSVRLSAAGLDLWEAADRVASDIERLLARASALRSGSAGVVRIGCNPFQIPSYLGEVLRSFNESHPDIAIDLSKVRDDRSSGGRAIVDDLLAGRVDIILTGGEIEGLPSASAYQTNVVAVLPDDHPFRTKKRIDVGAFRGERLLLTPRGHVSRELLEVCFASFRPGFEPDVAAAISSAAALLALGRAGFGIPLIVDAHLPSPAEPRYPTIKGPSGDLTIQINLTWRDDREVSPAVQGFIQHVRRQTSGHSTGILREPVPPPQEANGRLAPVR